MKKFVVILFVCLLAVCSFAADKSVTITATTNMNGHVIAPGDYKVRCEIKGSTADVKLMQSGKTVATATGEVVQVKDAPRYNAVVNHANADGSNAVVEIQFANQNNVIRLNAEGTAVGK